MAAEGGNDLMIVVVTDTTTIKSLFNISHRTLNPNVHFVICISNWPLFAIEMLQPL